MNVFEVFATVSFAFTLVAASWAVARWMREPAFEILFAEFEMEDDQKEKDEVTVKHGKVTIVATGGHRHRLILDHQLWLNSGSVVYRTLPSPIDLPPHETRTFTLEQEPVPNVPYAAKRPLHLEVHLRVGRIWLEPIRATVEWNRWDGYILEKGKDDLAEYYGPLRKIRNWIRARLQ